jgi:hypothetical protein
MRTTQGKRKIKIKNKTKEIERQANVGGKSTRTKSPAN